MVILGFVGLLASGKGAATDYLVKKYQASHYGFSDALRQILKRLYLEETRENLVNLSFILRQKFGEDILAHTMSKDIANDQHEYIVVDGIRRAADIKYLKDLPNFHLISVEADPKIRYERLIKRSQNKDDQTKTYEEFLKDHEKETEISIVPLIPLAEFKLDNNGTEEQLDQQIEKIINKLKK